MNSLMLPKFSNGAAARQVWSKTVDIGGLLSIGEFNSAIGDEFAFAADIVLDQSARQTTIMCVPRDKVSWSEDAEHIYAIVKDGAIVKLGGTRCGMKPRFGSYLCGHHVIERGKSGKMSVTNAYLYHSIERDLLETDAKWSFWTWKLPKVVHVAPILGVDTVIDVQTFHAYESVVIQKYKSITGAIPILCDNADPKY